MNTRSLAKPC